MACPDAHGGTTTITERRYDLKVSGAIGDRVQSINATMDSHVERDARTRETTIERVPSPRIVIAFRHPEQGVRGMPVTPAATRKLRKMRFTVASIQAIPEGARNALAGPHYGAYDERAFRLTCFTPKGGRAQHDEMAFDVVDELSVLQFLYEHDLLVLYDIPHLTSCGFLPKRDEDRLTENAIAAQFATTYGAAVPTHAPHTFHVHRLLDQLIIAHDGAAERAMADLERMARGRFMAHPGDPSLLARPERFLGTAERPLARVIYVLPNGSRCIAIYEHEPRRLVRIEPIRQYTTSACLA